MITDDELKRLAKENDELAAKWVEPKDHWFREWFAGVVAIGIISTLIGLGVYAVKKTAIEAEKIITPEIPAFQVCNEAASGTTKVYIDIGDSPHTALTVQPGECYVGRLNEYGKVKNG